MKFIVSAMAILLLLTGCATLMGSASYTYSSFDPATGRNVRLTINSRRDVAGPVDLEIATDGTVKVKTGTLKGGGLTATESVLLNALIGRVLGPVAAPAPAEEPQE